VFDLGAATGQLSELVSGVRDDQLTDPTPCADWAVADLLAHVHQFATVFTQNARKEALHAPSDLVGDWRSAIPEQLDELAKAWRAEAAWSGRVAAGGVEMDAAANAVVAIEELTVHGWDLATATGRGFRAEDADLDQVDAFFELFAAQIASGEGPYGPEVPAPAGATRLERTIARTGRDPAWRA
jgi:uncharacterized protein (TIGR03086 family)